MSKQSDCFGEVIYPAVAEGSLYGAGNVIRLIQVTDVARDDREKTNMGHK